MKTVLFALFYILFGCVSFACAQQNSYLVKDIKRGKLGSNPTSLVAKGGFVYFVAEDGIHGSQLWKTDGTEAGTHIVRILPSHAISNLTEVQGKIYFFVYYAGKTYLWKSDGTEEGTQVVTELGTVFLNYFLNCRNVNGLFLFTISNGPYPGIWRSDGTAQGTYLLKGVNPNQDITGGFVHLDGTLYFSFSANYGQVPPELWKTNGTIEGTQLVRAGLPGLSQMTDINNTLYFVSGTALWKSNGTNAGTNLVVDLQNPVGNFTVIGNGEMYFTMFNQKSSSYELWKSNGTEGGTFKLTKIPNPYPNAGYQFKVIGNKLFFNAISNGEQELFVSDGTESGTGLVRDIYFNYSSGPSSFTEIDRLLYFTTWHPTLQMSEIWRTDGTAQGTRRIDSNGNYTYPGINSPTILYENGLLYFVSHDSYTNNQFGNELWAIDIKKITDIKYPENSITSNSLHIYPNPVENSATISVKGEIIENSEYVLFDVLGREVRRFKTGLSQFTFDRNSLNAGMYTLQLRNKSGTIQQRLVISN